MGQLLFQFAVSNALLACGLAALALLVGRLSDRPRLAHALWLLVLIKLVTPPLIPIPLNLTAHDVTDDPGSLVLAAPVPADSLATGIEAASATDSNQPLPTPPVGFWPSCWSVFAAIWQPLVAGIWLTGTGLVLVVSLIARAAIPKTCCRHSWQTAGRAPATAGSTDCPDAWIAASTANLHHIGQVNPRWSGGPEDPSRWCCPNRSPGDWASSKRTGSWRTNWPMCGVAIT